MVLGKSPLVLEVGCWVTEDWEEALSELLEVFLLELPVFLELASKSLAEVAELAISAAEVSLLRYFGLLL